MQSIEQAAKEYVQLKPYSTLETPKLKDEAYDGFKAGVEFATKWIPVEQELPLCYESGDWDGLRSDFVLIKDKYNNWSKGILYSGIIDGHNFNDWYSTESLEMPFVTHWRPIELK